MLFKIKSLKRVTPLKIVKKKKTLYDHGYKSVYVDMCFVSQRTSNPLVQENT